MIYSGTVTNLSKNGMFVRTNVHFPVSAEIMMVVLLNDHAVKIPIKIKRAVKETNNLNPGVQSGIGVELLETPQQYIKFVSRCKSHH